ncbi:MAG: hypothetical protein V7K41_12115 [Nostoc sp.]|uniref:hypothetical protein n=1 Tax=Nostoc sp. TaxID=1180 RepID=UPI002FFAFEE4
MTTTKPIPANSSESKLESLGNAVAPPANDFGFVVNGNLNYWSLFWLDSVIGSNNGKRDWSARVHWDCPNSECGWIDDNL